ncbi:3-dehydroquinate synthase II [Micromonospora inyonensis]|uniref:3-dehydroquinate synthase II n=1 Tax=Micromonospora inyonensis TaxID=47866 RepID=A0A1C6RLF4_9ACTN|nr:3-dehydroquinate synthase II [Micromonospora inyonensis]SCL17990.1 3-dehydroquinate synthase II [Micromonospora inyonensis]
MTESLKSIPVWCDLRHLDGDLPARLTQVLHTPVSGVLLRPAQLPADHLPERVRTMVMVDETGQLDDLDPERPLTVVSAPGVTLGRLPGRWSRGVWIDIDDADGLRDAVRTLDLADVVMLNFADATNIPLELLIAEAQSRRTVVVKNISSANDALVTMGVLEHGPHAVLLPVSTIAEIDQLARTFAERRTDRLELVDAEVVESRSIGMGMRGCVDAAATFEENEGMLVGSTSAGALLVCAEVHHLPYMNLRPFRVNAGGVHSYVWAPNGRTAYITDLRAGETALAVSTSGTARPVVVGRIKNEVRPLRLLRCRVEDTFINAMVQDDWHVRLFDADGKVRNCTDIKPGDRLMARLDTPGRHVGISVSESILEH